MARCTQQLSPITAALYKDTKAIQVYETRNLHDRLRTCYKTNIDLQRDNI